MTRTSIISVPPNVGDAVTLQRFLTRLVEQVDVLVGARGDNAALSVAQAEELIQLLRDQLEIAEDLIRRVSATFTDLIREDKENQDGQIGDLAQLITDLTARVDQLESDVQNIEDNLIPERLRMMGNYIPGTVYAKNDQVKDGKFLMYSLIEGNKDRPGPVFSDKLLADLPDAMTYTQGSFVGNVWAGTQYTFSASGWIAQIEIQVREITDNTEYRAVVSNVTDPLNPIRFVIPVYPSAVNEWTVISIPYTLIASGEVYQVHLDSYNKGTGSVVSGAWARENNQETAEPLNGNWLINANEDKLRISNTDAASANRLTDLLSIAVGSDILLVSSTSNQNSVSYEIRSAPVNLGASVEWEVIKVNTGSWGPPIVGDSCAMTAVIPTPQGTLYSENVGYWAIPANVPTWATVEGLQILDGTTTTLIADDAYGVRIKFQPAEYSTQWGLCAVSEV